MRTITQRSGFYPLAMCALCMSLVGAQAQKPARPLVDPIQLFAYDKNLPLAPEEKALEVNAAYKAYAVSYYSANNQRVPAVYVVPAGIKTGDRIPCILIMHGLGMDKMGFKVAWKQFTDAGFGLLAIDAQFHGDRKPPPGVEVFGRSPYATRDLIIQTVIDLRRGVDYLESRPEVDPKRIGYLGLSMGGVLGSIVCGVDSRIQAPILWGAGGDFKLMSQTSQLQIAKDARAASVNSGNPAFNSAMNALDPLNWVGSISPRPVLFINGDADTIMPVACAKELHAAAKEPKEVFWHKGEHAPPASEMPKIFLKISSWLTAHFNPQKAGAQ